MIKAKFGDRLDAALLRAVPFLIRKPLNPNVLSVIGVVVSLLAAAAFPFGWFVAGGILIVAGGVFDLIDGVVARYHGVSTRFGAFLDSTLDRVSDMALLLGIAMYYAVEGEPGHVLLAGYTLAASALVSYAQARAELVLTSFRVGFLERGERIVILALGALTGFVVPALWILAVGSTVTVIQRFARAHREMAEIDAVERAAVGEQA
ncbi:MAG: CDP-alcohol phosphatidyltransferase family protein [Myxococcota bacterium]|nr:CDP-alcohol phosphatidyltransferase family protein [Myxococcota bacterium]